MSFSHSHSLSPYVGQNVCIDIFSVWRSPESRIGDRPRNRLSHFYVLRKWSGQVLSSISLSITGSPRCSLFHTASKWGNHHGHHASCPARDGWDESQIWRRQQRRGVYMNGASLLSDLWRSGFMPKWLLMNCVFYYQCSSTSTHQRTNHLIYADNKL